MDEESADCGHEGAELVPDPLIAEVYNETVWRYMCPDCEYERRMEV